MFFLLITIEWQTHSQSLKNCWCTPTRWVLVELKIKKTSEKTIAPLLQLNQKMKKESKAFSTPYLVYSFENQRKPKWKTSLLALVNFWVELSNQWILFSLLGAKNMSLDPPCSEDSTPSIIPWQRDRFVIFLYQSLVGVHLFCVLACVSVKPVSFFGYRDVA